VIQTSIATLANCSQEQLDALFREGSADRLPDGPVAGVALFAPGTALSPVMARLTQACSWQGKVFDASRGTVRNKITPFGITAVAGDVYRAPSWVDGKECVVLDYTKTSHLGRRVRDELREIAPGRYLGRAYWRRIKVFDFALQQGGMPGRVRLDAPSRASPA